MKSLQSARSRLEGIPKPSRRKTRDKNLTKQQMSFNNLKLKRYGKNYTNRCHQGHQRKVRWQLQRLFRNQHYRIRSTPPAVGADPCVRPTTVGRTESAKEGEAKDGNGKEEANAKSAEICRSDIGRTHGSAPTGGSCTQSTTIGTCTFMRYLTPHPSPLKN